MARATKVEDRHARLALVHDAGRGRVSGLSTAAGVLAGFGAFALVLGIAVAIAQVVGVDARGFSRGEWRAIGLGSGIATAIVVLGAWWFGGYVAGRMARRAGASHGLAVFVTTVVVLVVAAAIVWAEGGPTTIRDGLRAQGAPTDSATWWGIGALTGLLTFVGGLVGSFFGGIRGERWHQHLVEDALDPEIGPEAEARREADERNAAARDRVATASPGTDAGAGAHDDFLRRDAQERSEGTGDGDRGTGERVVPVVAPDAPVPMRERTDAVDVAGAQRDEQPPDEHLHRESVPDDAVLDDGRPHRFARWVRSGR